MVSICHSCLHGSKISLSQENICINLLSSGVCNTSFILMSLHCYLVVGDGFCKPLCEEQQLLFIRACLWFIYVGMAVSLFWLLCFVCLWSLGLLRLGYLLLSLLILYFFLIPSFLSLMYFILYLLSFMCLLELPCGHLLYSSVLGLRYIKRKTFQFPCWMFTNWLRGLL